MIGAPEVYPDRAAHRHSGRRPAHYI